MSYRFNARLHHRFGLIHDSVEGAFLRAGIVLSTLALLIIVYVMLWFLER
ncbi:MAG TPA: hypothetical protein VKT49_12770 [Bryobacteraceae bacterium]|nr:hypothetical protein [Bryobacteraceae bacterium]